MSSSDSMLDVYIFENTQLLEELEPMLLDGEKNGSFTAEQIAGIMRILHTIKGSSAMMGYDSISGLSHALEDLYTYLQNSGNSSDHHQTICNLSYQTLDSITAETAVIQNGGVPGAGAGELVGHIKTLHQTMTGEGASASADTSQPQAPDTAAKKAKPESSGGKYYYRATVFFEDGCKMENVRALGVIKSLEPLCAAMQTIPEDLLADHCDDIIVSEGLTVYMRSDESLQTIENKINETFFLQSAECEALDALHPEIAKRFGDKKKETTKADVPAKNGAVHQQYLSVNTAKLDRLMDLVGEIVIAESTVTQNPDVLRLASESFGAASLHLTKLTGELRDVVMSIRMIPVSATFHKMERIVRDTAAKVDKKAKLILVGEETELDKNVLDKLSDPLMHIVRNAVDHGLETAEQRISKGKDPVGEIRLEAHSSSGHVTITISDDGKGLNKNALVEKGIASGLITKPADQVTDDEAYSLMFASGVSTKEDVTEISGRGVGMNVVAANIGSIGGSVSVSSKKDQGMRVDIQIPLTLSIITGMQVSVGSENYILPALSVKESFQIGAGHILRDPDGNEMFQLRGACYPVIRLSKLFNIDTGITDIEEGILVLIESKSQDYCLLVDRLIAQQQAVVKPVPAYISSMMSGWKPFAGCTILGDGSVCLILDINGLLC